MHNDLDDGLKPEVVEGVEILLSRGWRPYDVLTQALVAGMPIVGIDFRDGILFVPEVLMSANAMKAGMAVNEGRQGCITNGSSIRCVRSA
jgi:5-methyltetrahydrofolate--homocysteine methyltransferase